MIIQYFLSFSRIPIGFESSEENIHQYKNKEEENIRLSSSRSSQSMNLFSDQPNGYYIPKEMWRVFVNHIFMQEVTPTVPGDMNLIKGSLNGQRSAGRQLKIGHP